MDTEDHDSTGNPPCLRPPITVFCEYCEYKRGCSSGRRTCRRAHMDLDACCLGVVLSEAAPSGKGTKTPVAKKRRTTAPTSGGRQVHQRTPGCCMPSLMRGVSSMGLTLS
jgi:hypothetical protein